MTKIKTLLKKMKFSGDCLTIFFTDKTTLKLDIFEIRSVSVQFLKKTNLISFLKLKQYQLVFKLQSDKVIKINLPDRLRSDVIDQLRRLRPVILSREFCRSY